MRVIDYLRFLNASHRFVDWPPDVFAVVASLLQKSGAYTRVVSGVWPPADPNSSLPAEEQAAAWADTMAGAGQGWQASVTGAGSLPPAIRERWQAVLDPGHLTVSAIRNDERYCTALIELCAMSDEACAGIGLPPTEDDFHVDAWLTLTRRGTLCKTVDATVARVLPKCHAPTVGITLRSLSHHLSLIGAGDVEPKWYVVNRATVGDRGHALNLLLVPSPKLVLPTSFREVAGLLRNMNAAAYGFFSCSFESGLGVDEIVELFDAAKRLAGSVDGVVLPELAMTEREYLALREKIVDQRGAILISGVGHPAADGEFGKNYVRFDMPIELPETGESNRAAIEPQRKHHRWLLDGSQIHQYGLSARLSADRKWWECIDVSRRELAFVALEPWLTASVLVCEDLARQDPVADLLRSVGPNLVIALLADGPQLAARWPSRYATVLADDPGSSVLTLTSVGMVDLCRGPRRMLGARPVALWKDAKGGGPFELNLPADADALLLCLGAEYTEEWTADGRSDRGTTSYLKMLSVHPIARR